MRSTLSLGLLFLAACSSSPAAVDAPKEDPTDPKTPAITPPPVDDTHGAPSETYPAYTPTMAELQNRGGKVLDKPLAIAITFDDDPNRATWEKITDELGTTDYWKAIVSEYGVGTLTSGDHVHTSRKITLSSDPDVDPYDTIFDWVKDQIQDPTSGFPAPTDQTIYTIYFSGKQAQALCDAGAGGLHDELRLDDGKDVSVALVFACDGDPTMNAVESGTVSASHELAEAATDPLPQSQPGWQTLRREDLSWELMQMVQDENGDMCEFYDDVYGSAAAPALTLMVQRQWSNAAAKAGHAPCVPALPGPYFNVALLDKGEAVLANLEGLGDIPLDPHGTGYVIPQGQTKKIALGFVSDGPTEEMAVSAFEADAFDDQGFTLIPAQDKYLDVVLDKGTGKNGEKTYLSITTKAAIPHAVRLVVVKTKIGNTNHFMPLIVAASGDGSAQSTSGGLRSPDSADARPIRQKGSRARVGNTSRAWRNVTPATATRLLPSLRGR